MLEKIEYKVNETTHGTWRRYVYPSGAYFAEFRSHAQVFGMPFLHYTRGKCPETGKRIIAKGFIAVGRIAMGVIAFGQASAALVFCVAQIGGAVVAVGQIAVGALFGLGQVATGATAIGQLALGGHVLAQIGFGEHLWTPERADPEAVKYFQELWSWISSLFAAPK
jgi:hypothetical protein